MMKLIYKFLIILQLHFWHKEINKKFSISYIINIIIIFLLNFKYFFYTEHKQLTTLNKTVINYF